jgi:hypothetical protein
MDLFADHEIAIARAEPNVMPDRVTSLLADIIPPFFNQVHSLYFLEILKEQEHQERCEFETDPADHRGMGKSLPAKSCCKTKSRA